MACIRCEDCHSLWLEPQISVCKAAGHVGTYDDEPMWEVMGDGPFGDDED